MRSFPPATAACLASRGAIVSRTLIWIRARNRISGAEEALGLWNGDDHQNFRIDGETRLYTGAGGLVSVDPLTMQSGLVVRMHRVSLSPLAGEVEQAIRGYDPRLAPVEIHRALFAADTRDLIDAPRRVFRGWIDAVQITTPAAGGTARCDVTLASSARALTRTLGLKKSDESQKLRSGPQGSDRFARYGDISGAVAVSWGEKKGGAA